MPTYTYRCKECEHQFDQRQSFSEDALKECPACGAETGLRKVVNSVGIVFKGSGFYVTDNKNGKNAKSNGSSSSKNESKETSTSSTKSKSDSASKSESKDSSKKSSSSKEKSSV